MHSTIQFSPIFDGFHARIRIDDIRVTAANVLQILVMRNRIMVADAVFRYHRPKTVRETVDCRRSDTARRHTTGHYHRFHTFPLHERKNRCAVKDRRRRLSYDDVVTLVTNALVELRSRRAILKVISGAYFPVR